jgi:hypothetical protein
MNCKLKNFISKPKLEYRCVYFRHWPWTIYISNLNYKNIDEQDNKHQSEPVRNFLCKIFKIDILFEEDLVWGGAAKKVYTITTEPLHAVEWMTLNLYAVNEPLEECVLLWCMKVNPITLK